MPLTRTTLLAAVRDGIYFDIVRKGQLPHATSSKFEPGKWLEIFDSDKATSRDLSLITAYLFISRELSRLRLSIYNHLSGIDSEISRIDASSAVTNFSLNSIIKQFKDAFKSANKGSDILFFGDTGDYLVKNTGGQSLNVDDAIANLADAVPYFYFHTQSGPDNRCQGISEFIKSGPQFSSLTSIEKSLRDIWQQVLWEAYSFKSEGGTVYLAPEDKEMSEYWLAWRRRAETIAMQTTYAEVGAQILTGESKAAQLLPTRAVIAYEKKHGQKPCFVVSRRKNPSEVYEVMMSAVKGTYLDAFNKAIFPAPFQNISLNDLIVGWSTLSDIYNLTVKKIPRQHLNSQETVRRWSLNFPRAILIEAFSKCGGWDREKSKDVISIFSADVKDTSRLFNNGLWGAPLLDDGKGNLRVIGAVLISSNPILTIERWMDRIGFTENSKDRGIAFENYVRNMIYDNIKNTNSTIESSVISVKSNGRQSEEIDAIFTLGNRIVVVEVKCFNTPFEPLERHNHLKKVEEAVRQAKRKAKWVERNLEFVREKLGHNAPFQPITVTPIVLLNNPYCSGSKIDDCLITDFKWLDIVLSQNEVIVGSRIERGVSIGFKKKRIYNDDADLVNNFERILMHIPSIEMELRRIEWRQIDFPTSDGKSFKISTPTSVGNPSWS